MHELKSSADKRKEKKIHSNTLLHFSSHAKQEKSDCREDFPMPDLSRWSVVHNSEAKNEMSKPEWLVMDRKREDERQDLRNHHSTI